MQNQITLSEIKRTQNKVQDTVVSLGGYWRPLSALARVLEEVGEIGELLACEEPVQFDALALELADVFVISTCLANQYCANLSCAYKNLKWEKIRPSTYMPGAVDDSLRLDLCRLAHRTGRLARVINGYEGDKPPKKSDSETNVSVEVAGIHFVLLEMAFTIDYDLIEAVDKVLDASGQRDLGRFLKHWDPSVSPTLEAFRPIVETTPCIFAKRAKLWAAPDYDGNLSIQDNAVKFTRILARFCKVAPSEGLDGYVIRLTDYQHFADIPALAKVLKLILNKIGEMDEQRGVKNPMQCDLFSPSWRFSFRGTTFFITTFAPFYEVRHPRRSPLPGAAFIFLQPEFSFNHHGIHSGNPNREAVKKLIREGFDRELKSYSVELVEQPIEAFKYIKPMHKDGEPVVWWD
jgi:NTP pyrophosphatase (non-canonical NTP hydrolase)/FPC/CPF motif-containing protein YcgG